MSCRCIAPFAWSWNRAPRLLDATDTLGQHFMDAMLPNGWPDTAADWVSGEAILKRADWAMTQVSRPGAPTADSVIAATLGELCCDTTRAAVARCPNPAEALATSLSPPNFCGDKPMRPTRRGFLVGATAAASMGRSIRVRAAGTDSRFVLIFLRGAMDGLSIVVPYGDRNLARLRPALLPPDPGQPDGLLDLGGFWGLHPALKTMHALYEAGDLLPIQCVAGPNRSRSHFEAQDMMEIGAETRMTSGWLNRIAALLPAAPACDIAFTMANRLPLILHGPAPATPWDPFRKSPLVSAGFYENIAAMHAADTVVGPELVDGLRERRYVDTVMAGLSYDGVSNGFPRAARATARLLAAPDGPRLAELDLDGWDTHTDQPSRLPYTLRDLDEGIGELRAGLAGVWGKTVILVLTEFGRTVPCQRRYRHRSRHGNGGIRAGRRGRWRARAGRLAGHRPRPVVRGP
jgi:uncharacterized protein (DUF1501 family)